VIDAGDPTAIGPFVVLRKLGEGAMGVVYAGYDVALDRKVAIKLVHRHLLNRPQVRTRMVREAQAMARLSSPYVVQVFQVGDHGDQLYLAMEFVDGVTLSELAQGPRRPWQAGPPRLPATPVEASPPPTPPASSTATSSPTTSSSAPTAAPASSTSASSRPSSRPRPAATT
jgi:cell division septation protein DedD